MLGQLQLELVGSDKHPPVMNTPRNQVHNVFGADLCHEKRKQGPIYGGENQMSMGLEIIEIIQKMSKTSTTSGSLTIELFTRKREHIPRLSCFELQIMGSIEFSGPGERGLP